MFRNSLSKFGKDAALGVKRNGEWVTWTYEDYWRDARRAARDVHTQADSSTDTEKVPFFSQLQTIIWKCRKSCDLERSTG